MPNVFIIAYSCHQKITKQPVYNTLQSYHKFPITFYEYVQNYANRDSAKILNQIIKELKCYKIAYNSQHAPQNFSWVNLYY